MSVEERRRLELYEAARSHLGEPAADTLMELLPVDEFATGDEAGPSGVRG